jgi:pantetheine-phosphate adenylyltransferase
MKRALVPGSYNPITLGHLDLILRAAELFDEVYAVIFDNCDKN